MTAKVMDKVLKRFDVVEFSPLGEKFDPNKHDAVCMVPSDEYQNEHVG